MNTSNFTIDLKGGFTRKEVRDLIASGDDSDHTQIRVSDDGIAYLSDDVGADNLDGVRFRLETFSAGTDHVGQDAARDDDWIDRIYEVLAENWPDPDSHYIDTF